MVIKKSPSPQVQKTLIKPGYLVNPGLKRTISPQPEPPPKVKIKGKIR